MTHTANATSRPAFFLASTAQPGRPELEPEEEQHARRVLRLGPGDELWGLDGRGTRWPLRIRTLGKSAFELEMAGAPLREPAPGEEGAPLPWFELAISWPKKPRVEDMLNRLTQLGVAAIRPLAARQRGPSEVPEGPSARTLRVLREACKQCGRSWLPRIEGVETPEACARRADARYAVLDPSGGLALDVWLRSHSPAPVGVGTERLPLVLVIGPEGGFTAEERSAFLERGASLTWLHPHILRVETAAEAAMALAAAIHGRVRRP